MITVRAGDVHNFDFLVEMMIEAAHWRPGTIKPSPEEAVVRTDLAPYVKDWGREGDYMAIAQSDDDLVGCAWYRFYTADEHGHGYLSDDIPELGIACRAQYRGQGAGRLLIDDLCDHARGAGIAKLCLSASTDNYAFKLYFAT